MSSIPVLQRRRWIYVATALAVVTAGLASRKFCSSWPLLLRKYPGDLLWAALVYLIIACIWTKWHTKKVLCIAFAYCLTVEFSKLIPSQFLSSIRQSDIGHLILGRVFMWENIVAYLLGILLVTLIEVYANGRVSGPPS